LFLLQGLNLTAMTTEHAVKLLTNVFRGFPYRSQQQGVPVAVSCAMTLMVRPLLWQMGAACPGLLINASESGIGKTLLTEVLLDMTGRPKRELAWREEQAELAQQVDAVVSSGEDVLLFENLGEEAPMAASALCAYLTRRKTVRSHLPGRSEGADLPWLCTVLVTGDNLDVQGKAARRFVQVNLSKQDHLRFDRSAAELSAYVRDHRALLQSALLTLLSAHMQTKSTPGELRPMPGFDAWRGIVAGCVRRFFGSDPIDAQAVAAEQIGSPQSHCQPHWQSHPSSILPTVIQKLRHRVSLSRSPHGD
jgi:hypothetical protein